MNRLLYIGFLGLLVNCSNFGQLTFIAELPVDEASGLASLDDHTVWIIEDHGNPDKLYRVDRKGRLLKELQLTNAKNDDWEDLATDEEGNLYIGDIGNNDHRRREFVIYRVPNPADELGDQIGAEAIRFYYPEPDDAGLRKKRWVYNAEAFFFRNGYLYLITKNDNSSVTRQTYMFRIPAETGNHRAEFLRKFALCEERYSCQATAADISPNGETVAMLGYGKLWLLRASELDSFTGNSLETIDLGATTQLESVCFTDDNTLLMADEVSAGAGGNLYSFKLEAKADPE